MIIIQSQKENFLFGGFTKLPWSYKRGFKQDPDAFLFTLTNPHRIPAMKFDVKKEKSDNAIYHSGYGYIGDRYDFYLFGFGGDGLHAFNFYDYTDGVRNVYRGDLFICDRCDQNSYSRSKFPCSYTDTSNRGSDLFTGSSTFSVNDIEVYVST